MPKMIVPRPLLPGSKIGIVAASSPFSKGDFLCGVRALESLGFRVKFGGDIFRKKSYLAGSDLIRASELNRMLADPDIGAVMFARGGYGVQRILPRIDFRPLANNPKLVIGCSDLTALLSHITSRLRMKCLYGPVVTGLAAAGDETMRALKDALEGETRFSVRIEKPRVIKAGSAEGRLMGGCLSLISSSVGTAYGLDAKGAVLFLEDRGEKIYRYDRMLTHLKNAGMFKGAKGIVFGSMGLVKDEKGCETKLWRMVKDVLADFSGPVVAGLPAGHTAPFLTLPLGAKCRLDAEGGRTGLEFWR